MKAGRQRTFDKQIALESAMHVFWSKGYPGTSLADLTAAMGINKPSLYAAFGNKEKLYRSALESYVNKQAVIHNKHLCLADTGLRKRLQSYLTSIAEMVTDPALPGGCFVCISTSEVGGNCIPEEAAQDILNINQVTKSSLSAFFESEIVAGHISTGRSPVVMANYILSLQFGLAVMARNGAELSELIELIKLSTEQF